MKIAALIGAGILVLFTVIILVLVYISYSNKEIDIRTSIEAKQRDNMSQLDNTLKIISQNAQATQAQAEMLKDIIVGNAAARNQRGGNLATLVTEAVPNLDQSTETYRLLMNTITSARNQWTNNQTALLDLKRAHDRLLRRFPGNIILSGRGSIDVTIVTSTRTEEAFNTGKDDNTDIFK